MINFEFKLIEQLIHKYKSMRSGYFNQSPRGKWEYVRNMSESMINLLGLSVMDPNYKPRWYAYFPLVYLIEILFSYAYTAWKNRNDPSKALCFIPCFAVVIPVSPNTF